MSTVPRLSPEAYRMTLPGGRGTIEMNADGTGTVRDLSGRAVVTLPGHVAALAAPAPAPVQLGTAPEPERVSVLTRITRRNLLTRALRLA